LQPWASHSCNSRIGRRFSAAFIGWGTAQSGFSSSKLQQGGAGIEHPVRSLKNEGEERNQTEFFKTVHSTEDILGSKRRIYQAMQEALRDF
jgi:hypothetical protein